MRVPGPNWAYPASTAARISLGDLPCSHIPFASRAMPMHMFQPAAWMSYVTFPSGATPWMKQSLLLLCPMAVQPQ